MLKLQNVCFHTPNKTLLDNVSLELRTGNVCGLLGPNGAGKSTVLKAISGDIPATGTITFHDKRLSDWNSIERARHLAVLPQSSQLTFPFSAREVVALGLTPLSVSRTQAEQLIKEKMYAADCLSFSERAYPSLSGGERQRVQLARVLLQLSKAEQAPLLLLDEPTSAQDLGQQHNILALTQELAKAHGFGIVTILHDLNQVLKYCDDCYLLDQGQVRAHGAPEDILSNKCIREYWQYEPERVNLSSGQLALI